MSRTPGMGNEILCRRAKGGQTRGAIFRLGIKGHGAITEEFRYLFDLFMELRPNNDGLLPEVLEGFFQQAQA